MALSKYFYNFLNGNYIKNLLIVFIVVVVVGVLVSFIVLFVNGLVVTVDIVIIKNKDRLISLSWNEGREVCFDGAHACTHLLLMLLFFV